MFWSDRGPVSVDEAMVGFPHQLVKPRPKPHPLKKNLGEVRQFSHASKLVARPCQ